MKTKILLPLISIICFFSCKIQENHSLYESNNLKIEQLTKNTYRHISYLSTETFGKVACNGMIIVDKKEALIFDTPTNDTDSKELINWVEKSLGCKVVGVIINHFHDDCLGGLHEFHQRKIPSYASFKTIQLAKSDSIEAPQNGFNNYLEIKVGDKKVINEFLGEGHTIDNIVSYFPDEKVLFGGCLIKAVDASKGNLADANTNKWSSTVGLVKSKYKNAKIIIPGHGNPGNTKLLDYTIDLFKTN